MDWLSQNRTSDDNGQSIQVAECNIRLPVILDIKLKRRVLHRYELCIELTTIIYLSPAQIYLDNGDL